jgi:leucyl-tRNA synthetase
MFQLRLISSLNAPSLVHLKPLSKQPRKKALIPDYRLAIRWIQAIKLPVHIANFVLMDYGTGAIFGCPAHDQRDLDFANAYGLQILPVVLPDGEDAASFTVTDTAYTGPGKLFNSGDWDGLDIEAGKAAAIAAITAANAGTGETTYRLRDWGVSRQRYWGCPIPIIHCR